MTCRLLLPCFLLAAMAGAASAETVVHRIKAYNPSSTETQTVTIHTQLPSGLRKDDIVDLGGLELRYDVQENRYYVHKEVMLPPLSSKVFSVEMADIWAIPQQSIEDLSRHAAGLAEMLKGTRHEETAARLRRRVEQGLRDVDQRQQATAGASVRAAEHISAYEQNMRGLDTVREDVAKMENLAVGLGLNPGRLHGALPKAEAPPLGAAVPAGAPANAVFRVRVANPSAAESAVLAVKRFLPAEVRPEDIIDPAGLSVGYDADRQAACVYKDNVAVGPRQTVSFDVLVRNRWMVDADWLGRLNTRITNIVARARQSAAETIVTEGEALRGALDAERRKEPPKEVDDQYIRFFREQRAAYERIDAGVMRLEQLLAPRKTTEIFDAPILEKIKAPTARTTWIIIYIILGFLGLVSLLFFLRWYGRSKSEQR